MALECAHCGARCDDGATRCPKCLRTTHLEKVAAPVPTRVPAPRAALFAAGGVIALLGAGAAVFLLRAPPSPTRVMPSSVPTGAGDPLEVGAELAPQVAQLRGVADVTARARRAGELVQAARRAQMFSEGDEPPPPRAPDLVWRLLPRATERVTELDLARLVAAMLRASGVANAFVALRTAPVRPDEPIDPTGVLGRYGVRVNDHLVDVVTGALLPAATSANTPLPAVALAGAISAQAAVETSARGAREQALQYANAAVEAWPDAPVPLAARAQVWVDVGGSSGITLADADLTAASAMRDDAPYHMARARLLLAQSRLVEAAMEARRAAVMAPAWGTAMLATHAFRDVYAHLDAGAAPGCAGLRAARAPWTDDAYALCGDGVDAATRAAAGQRMLTTSRDPLRVAWATLGLPDVRASQVAERVTASARPELARWLVLLGRADLLVEPQDAGR